MRRKIGHFSDLDAWKYGHKLAITIYNITKGFPREELFGMTNQIRRASASITANIAEGMGRFSYKERVRFFYNARGSLFEVESITIMARDVGLLNEKQFEETCSLIEKAGKTLSGLISASKKRVRP